MQSKAYQELVKKLEARGFSNLTRREHDFYYLACSKCGQERDAEGWCPGYCLEEEEV